MPATCPRTGRAWRGQGAGLRVPWPLLTPLTLRRAVRRALDDDRLAIRAAQLAAWSQLHDGPGRAAELVERLARGQSVTQ